MSSKKIISKKKSLDKQPVLKQINYNLNDNIDDELAIPTINDSDEEVKISQEKIETISDDKSELKKRYFSVITESIPKGNKHKIENEEGKTPIDAAKSIFKKLTNNINIDPGTEHRFNFKIQENGGKNSIFTYTGSKTVTNNDELPKYKVTALKEKKNISK